MCGESDTSTHSFRTARLGSASAQALSPSSNHTRHTPARPSAQPQTLTDCRAVAIPASLPNSHSAPCVEERLVGAGLGFLRGEELAPHLIEVEQFVG